MAEKQKAQQQSKCCINLLCNISFRFDLKKEDGFEVHTMLQKLKVSRGSSPLLIAHILPFACLSTSADKKKTTMKIHLGLRPQIERESSKRTRRLGR